MSFKPGVLIIAFLIVQLNVNGQGDKFFYDTLVVMDYTTNESSERVSRMKKPLIRTFFLKSQTTSYTLFKNNVAKLTADQVLEVLDSGFSLYFDKQEYQGHKNLKPSMLEVLSESNEVVETIEDLSAVKESVLKRKLVPGAKIRLSGFIVSVNEKRLGPIQMDVSIVE